MRKKIYHITHIDSDAVGCEVLLKLYYKDDDELSEYSTHWSSNNNVSDNIVTVFDEIDNDIKLNIFPNTEYYIYITDVSPAVGTEGYNRLLDFSISDHSEDEYSKVRIRMFDHHKTNPFKNLTSGLNFIINVFETDEDLEKDFNYIYWTSSKISATMVLYKYLKNKENFKKYDTINTYKMVSDISRYDTWEWIERPSPYGSNEDATTNALKIARQQELSDEIFEYLCSIKDAPKTSELGKYLKDESYQNNNWSYRLYLPEKYAAIHEMAHLEFDKYMRDISYKLKISKSGEYVYGLIMCDSSNINMSLVTDKINRVILPDVLDYIVILFPTSRNISFRTIKDTVDVSRIAKRCYGGGGHVKASSARVDIPTFTSFITEYWTSHSLEDFIKRYQLASDTYPLILSDKEIISYINGDE